MAAPPQQQQKQQQKQKGNKQQQQRQRTKQQQLQQQQAAPPPGGAEFFDSLLSPSAVAGVQRIITAPKGAPGATVGLDGSASSPMWGTRLVDFSWEARQLGGGGGRAAAKGEAAQLTLAPGEWIVELTVKDSNGAAGADTARVTIKPARSGRARGSSGGAQPRKWERVPLPYVPDYIEYCEDPANLPRPECFSFYCDTLPTEQDMTPECNKYIHFCSEAGNDESPLCFPPCDLLDSPAKEPRCAGAAARAQDPESALPVGERR
ncbi:MAG: hypothetical protein J3K34DRAFT_272901 [Monoraphidium minutum]|nr:MAG: hypothetical protein J3K34DRAFT_272901 [Monoraphidium minutum]